MPSLISSLESVLSMSAKSLAEAEEASRQAKGALEAARRALEILRNSEPQPDLEPDSVDVKVKPGEIVDVDDDNVSDGDQCPSYQYSRDDLLALQGVPLSRKKPGNLPELCIVKESPHHMTFTALASSEPALFNSSVIPRGSVKNCNFVKQLSGTSTVGRIVKYCGGNGGVGRTWSPEMKDGVGVILGYDRGYLLLKWCGEEIVRKVLFIIAEGDIGKYQFEYCDVDADQFPLMEVITAVTIPPVSEDSRTPSQCDSCQDEYCPEGKFLTHYEDSYIGMRVRFCGEMKKRVGVVKGYERSRLKVQWQGSQEVKKYNFINHREDFAKIQFKFCCHSEPFVYPESTKPVEEEEEDKADDEPLVLLSDPTAEIIDV